MSVILALDIGNSNIAIGYFINGKLAHRWRIATVRERTADELGILIKGLFLDRGLYETKLCGVVVSSVVPSLMYAVEEMCEQYLDCRPLIVGPGMRTGLVIKHENPRDMGSDRIAGAVAAIHLYGAPVIVVDFGTATTFTVIDSKEQYIGGVIAPGIKISSDALFQRASKLPRIDLVRPSNVIGKNTTSSMQSGIVFGFAGQVDGIVDRIRKEAGLPFRVVATGGLASVVSGESRTIEEVNPELTLRGLYLLWERNTTGKHPYDANKK